MALKNVLLAAVAIAPAAVYAQSGAYGQCGGIGWSGSKTCVSGYTCTYGNDWYSQCLPGQPPQSTQQPTSTKTTSTTKPPTTVTTATTTTGGNPGTTVIPTGPAVTGNPFLDKKIYANPYYSSEIHTLAIPQMTGAAKAAASKVAEVGTFVWLDTMAKVPSLDTYLGNIAAINAAGASQEVIANFVVYDLPDRDCAALASNGEYSIADGGVAKYKTYIDTIRGHLVKHSNVKVVLVIEPDSLANMVTNMGVAKCANAASTYKSLTVYAMEQLSLPNVSMYLDAGHAGWLGWAANIGPTADMFAELYTLAGKPKAVRGLATNVSNYNGFSVAQCAAFTSPNVNCDEKRYINALAPLLTAKGFPAHFIVDTSRSGVQPGGRVEWGDWCNVSGSGFGPRPTTNTGDALVDSFVWIKPGGECDGTSDTSAVRYDGHCGVASAMKPAPEAGQWFQAFFNMLVVNANP
ncbi:hypothetical protein ACLOAV_009120 [Pseudogymnoascus australis]